jgi:hypothetical protein
VKAFLLKLVSDNYLFNNINGNVNCPSALIIPLVIEAHNEINSKVIEQLSKLAPKFFLC